MTLSLVAFLGLLRSPNLAREAGWPVVLSEGGGGGPALDEPPSFSFEKKGPQDEQGRDRESGGAEEPDGADKHVGDGTEEPSRAGEVIITRAAAAFEDPA